MKDGDYMTDYIKAKCPYCKRHIAITDYETIQNFNRLGKFLYRCQCCDCIFMGYDDGENIKFVRVSKITEILKGSDNMIDKNTIFETVYNTIKDNMDWGFGCDNDKFTHFVDGIIAMAEGLIDKIEPKTEETEK